MEVKFEKNIIITGEIVCKTGLHIGGTKEELEIGGLDNPVIKDPRTGKPVIPGSSLKGKLRALLEIKYNKYSNDGSPHKCKEKDCWLCSVFGSSEEIEERGPTRLIVRDSICREDVEYEMKTENVINRLTGKAQHPRTFERVPAETKFNFEMIYSIYNEKDYENLRYVFEGMKLLEDNYLGGSGSRGYGKVVFKNIGFKVRSSEDYKSGEDGKEIEIEGTRKFDEVSEILQNFEKLKSEVKNV